MVDNADLIESSELLLDQYIIDAHQKGLNYWTILRIMLAKCIDLMIKSEIEYFIKGGK